MSSAIKLKLAIAWTDFDGRIGEFSGLWDKERTKWSDWLVKKRKQDRDLVTRFTSSRNRTLAIIRRQQSDQLNVRFVVSFFIAALLSSRFHSETASLVTLVFFSHAPPCTPPCSGTRM
jgi:hypothetical protein